LQVTFVGSGGPIVTKERSCPCILIDRDILLDCGSGTLKNLRQIDVDLNGIKKLLITHYHVDHIGDLPSLLWAMETGERKEPLEITGYKGIEELTKNLLKLMNTPEDITIFDLSFRPLSGETIFDGIRTCLTLHNPPNLAYRIERNGKNFCYTGDTAYHEPLAKFAYNCDIMVHDAMFLDEQSELASLMNHSTAGEAGKIAERAHVDTLVLFHIFHQNVDFEDKFKEQASREFSGKIIIAKDFQTLEI
jgi:ribonuclease Z